MFRNYQKRLTIFTSKGVCDRLGNVFQINLHEKPEDVANQPIDKEDKVFHRLQTEKTSITTTSKSSRAMIGKPFVKSQIRL